MESPAIKPASASESESVCKSISGFEPISALKSLSASHGLSVSKPWNPVSTGTAATFSTVEKLYLGMCYFIPYLFSGALVLIVDQKKLARFHAWQTILIAVVADTLIYALSSGGSNSLGVIIVVACWFRGFRFWLGRKIKLPFISPAAEKLSCWRYPA